MTHPFSLRIYICVCVCVCVCVRACVRACVCVYYTERCVRIIDWNERPTYCLARSTRSWIDRLKWTRKPAVHAKAPERQSQWLDDPNNNFCSQFLMHLRKDANCELTFSLTDMNRDSLISVRSALPRDLYLYSKKKA